MKFENTQVFNFEGALRGMRNPKDSWDKNDSRYDKNYNYIIGKNDLKLAQVLINAGKEHRKFLRQIMICVDITAPLYWYKEFDTYKIGTTANSCSTMHKIMSKPFTIDMFAVNHIRGYKKEVEQFVPQYDLSEEIWSECPLNNSYLVSNLGRVKRLQYITTHNRVWKERILTNTLTKDGYLKVGMKVDNDQKDVRVHRLVTMTFVPNPNNLPEVNHKDGNKLNNHVDNLEWATSSQNQQHAVENNLQPIHVNTYKGKFTEEQRNAIINEYNNTDVSIRKLAEKYNVYHSTISSIINNKYSYENHQNEFEEFKKTIKELNDLRDEYLETKDKEVWYTLIQKLPSSWLQKRTVTMNYENIYEIVRQRSVHRLKEWSKDTMEWIESLPYFNELCLKKGE